jgi:cell shape-determining protein MreC
VEREVEVWKVSVFAEDGPNGKSSYSLLLELGTGPNPSSLSRRTEEVTGLALGVEEKEIPVLARLVGRKLGIFSNRSTAMVQLEDLQRQNEELQRKIRLLEEKNQALREQLQYAHESLHRIS